jgi:hypothetical protein
VAGSLAACTRNCIGEKKSRGFTKSVHYPGIIATIERKLEQSALREKRERSWSALIGCNPTTRVGGRTVQAIGNRHDMACEENAHCTKSTRSCEEQVGKGISD